MHSSQHGLGILDRTRLARIGMRPDEERYYGFESTRPLTDAANFLGYRLYRSRVRPALNSPKAYAVTENKWIFYRLLASFGLPIPTTIGLFDPVFGQAWGGGPMRTVDDALTHLGEERPNGLVIKPAGGQQASGVTILDVIDHESGLGITRTGREVRLDQLLDAVRNKSERGFPGHILQAVIEQHSEIAVLSPAVTNTLRVVTLVADDKVHVQSVVIRLGRAGNMTDSWKHGGLSVPVDPETGVMGRGLLTPERGGDHLTSHPDTGASLEGVRLPLVAESVELCRGAARLLPGVRCVGWDVLITEDGPVLLEANSDWDLQLSQIHTDGFLARGAFRDEILSAGVRLPNALPSRVSSVPYVLPFVARRLTESAVANSDTLRSLRRRVGKL